MAMPIGTLMSSFNSLFTPLWASLAPFWEKLALEMKPKKFFAILFPFACFVTPAINMIVLFVAVAFGVEGLQGVLAKLPTWLRSGLSASSSMMTGIGFAITTAMIWTNETGIYFFVGYVMAAYLGLGNLPIAIFAAAIAFITFNRDKQTNDLRTELSGKAAGGVANSEEDFF
jgi:PTS system mannose-specific IIC component/fructoselysine and glucoselysine-specific PTS system IIC component